jgi:hypothetical protein
MASNEEQCRLHAEVREAVDQLLMRRFPGTPLEWVRMEHAEIACDLENTLLKYYERYQANRQRVLERLLGSRVAVSRD